MIDGTTSKDSEAMQLHALIQNHEFQSVNTVANEMLAVSLVPGLKLSNATVQISVD